jgi:hypothetical protein
MAKCRSKVSEVSEFAEMIAPFNHDVFDGLTTQMSKIPNITATVLTSPLERYSSGMDRDK